MSLKFCAFFGPTTALFLLASVNDARADLIHTGSEGKLFCGGAGAEGTEFLYSDTDPNGNSFTMNCINESYFQGTVVDMDSLPTSYKFGRCRYVNGANGILYELNSNNTFNSIEWFNVDPDTYMGLMGAAARTAVQAQINPLPGETTDNYVQRVNEFLGVGTDHGLDFTFYTTHFSPGVQTIEVFEHGLLTETLMLTPSQANMAYLPDGQSPFPALQIDPGMRLPNNSFQSVMTSPTPEPSTLTLLVIGTLGLLGYGRRRGKQAAA
jgi:hypothetical protein